MNTAAVCNSGVVHALLAPLSATPCKGQGVVPGFRTRRASLLRGVQRPVQYPVKRQHKQGEEGAEAGRPRSWLMPGVDSSSVLTRVQM